MECVEFLLGKQHPFVLGTPYLVVYTRWDCKWMMDESMIGFFRQIHQKLGSTGNIFIDITIWLFKIAMENHHF